MPSIDIPKSNAGSLQLHYQDFGKGRPVVLIHGWPLSSRTWEPQVTELVNAGFRVIAYDRRGFGASSHPWTGYDYDTLAQDLHELLAELTLQDVTLVGFSMGGGMAFYYAARHPALFSSVTAYAGTYHHYYNRGFSTVGAAPDMARALYEDMMREERYLEENNILCIVRQNADLIRGRLRITMHVGTDDILFCDNEILHLYLEALNIPHNYTLFQGIGHELQGIL